MSRREVIVVRILLLVAWIFADTVGLQEEIKHLRNHIVLQIQTEMES